MEVAGTHLALGPLLSGCYSVVKGINELRQSYQFMPMTLASITATCNVTRLALNQVDAKLADELGTNGDLVKEYVEQFEGIKISCSVTLSLLETHVRRLLDVDASEVSLAAQKSARKDKFKALYDESEMKALLRLLQDQNALLNTLMNLSQSNMQDKMLHMMTNQEKTLQNMVQASKSYHKYLLDAEIPVDSDAASICTAMTNGTALTAFDFDSIIMQSAVYKRCLQQHGGNTDSILGPLEKLRVEPTPTLIISSTRTNEETPEVQQRQPAFDVKHRKKVPERSDAVIKRPAQASAKAPLEGPSETLLEAPSDLVEHASATTSLTKSTTMNLDNKSMVFVPAISQTSNRTPSPPGTIFLNWPTVQPVLDNLLAMGVTGEQIQEHFSIIKSWLDTKRAIDVSSARYNTWRNHSTVKAILNELLAFGIIKYQLNGVNIKGNNKIDASFASYTKWSTHPSVKSVMESLLANSSTKNQIRQLASWIKISIEQQKPGKVPLQPQSAATIGSIYKLGSEYFRLKSELKRNRKSLQLPASAS